MNAPNHEHDHDGQQHPASHCHCCPDGGWHQQLAVSRRGFLTTAAVGGAMLTGLSGPVSAGHRKGVFPCLLRASHSRCFRFSFGITQNERI